VLKRRISDIHTFVGEDNAILHPDERLNDQDMYAAYTQAPDGESDEASAAAVDFTEIEERIRQLTRDRPELIDQIRELPAGVRTARRSPSDRTGAFVYLATDQAFEDLVVVDSTGKMTDARIEDVLALIECDESEPALSIPRRHNTIVSAALARFADTALERQTDRRTGPRLSAGQQFAVRHLSTQIRKEENEDRRSRLLNIERAIRGRLPEAALRGLASLRRMSLTSDLVVERLELLYRDLDLSRYARREDEVPHQPLARIVCSEALVAAEGGSTTAVLVARP
jgi:hypothetical protein